MKFRLSDLAFPGMVTGLGLVTPVLETTRMLYRDHAEAS